MENIKCKLCGRSFRRITNTHLWKEHQITMEEYKTKFPDASIDAPGLAESRVNHLRGKTYEEVYGEDKASELKQSRKDSAIEQMQDPEQITTRKEKCGYTPSEEQRSANSSSHHVHGGYTYRQRALDHYGMECARCGKTSENSDDFHVHHIDHVNVPSELGNHELDNLMVLCKSCHVKLHNATRRNTKEWVGVSAIEKGVHQIFRGLKEMGLDLNDPNFTDTPKRVARAFMEIFQGVGQTEEKVKEILSTSFPSEFDQMVIAKDVIAHSMCPHHLLPVEYKIQVGYIPGVDGEVIGISKLSRLVELLAQRPVLQEQFVDDVTKALMTIKGVRGAICIAEGRHFCMIMRGIKKPTATTVTSSIKGLFAEDPYAKSEFVQLIQM